MTPKMLIASSIASWLVNTSYSTGNRDTHTLSPTCSLAQFRMPHSCYRQIHPHRSLILHTNSTRVEAIPNTRHNPTNNHMRNRVSTSLQRSTDAEDDAAQHDANTTTHAFTRKQGDQGTNKAALQSKSAFVFKALHMNILSHR